MPWQLLRGVLVALSLGVCSLCAGSATVHEKTVMRWNVSDPLLHGMIYKDGGLIIQKEGYYYVYSKVSFSDSGVFQHSVTLSSEKYLNNVTLMQSRKYSSASKESESNSFLSGVFILYAGDRIFVTVSNTSKIMQNNNYENFGAFMI